MVSPAAFWASDASPNDIVRKTEHWAALAEEVAGVGYWQLDVGTRAIHWSEGLFRLYGLPVGDEPDLDSAMAAIHPDDSALANELLQRAMRDGINYSSEVRLRRTDGTWRTVTNRAVCVRDKAGLVATVLGTLLDVTDVRLADEALRRSEERYRLLADKSNDIIVRADKRGTILYISPSCRAMGYEPGELIGRNAAELVHPEDLNGFSANSAELFSGSSIDSGSLREHRFASKNGEWVWLQGNPTVIHDENGTPFEIINVFRDVTERRKAEAALSLAMVAAEDAAAVKAEFLANMSHELRTPLTSIIGFAQLLHEQPELSSQSTKFAERVVDASKTLLAVVNDILDFSKLEAGQVEIKCEPTSPRKIASEVVELLTPQAEQKSIALMLEISGKTPETVSLDGARVRQILHNLVGNAVKFTDEGSVTLSVRFAMDQLDFEVRDTGPGIEAEQIDRLFKRFSQVDGSSSRSHGGTGLGLAICKGLADAMGASIGVSSSFGHGAVFLLEIPTRATSAETLPPTSELPDSDLHGIRLLVADDNAANQVLIRVVLESLGATVVVVSNGQEAIDWAARSRFDVILMDLHMPVVDGYAAVRAIHAGVGPNVNTPILAFTADVMQRDETELTEAGFTGVVLKPISPRELLKSIHQARGRTHSVKSTARANHG